MGLLIKREKIGYCTPKVRVINSNFWGVFCMAKYSDKFKLMIVKEYLEGFLGYSLLARKHGIPSDSTVEKWVNSYKAFGEEGLRKKRSRMVYSVQFKLNVLNFMKQAG